METQRRNVRATPAQNAARARNWRIRSIRGLWSQIGHLSPERAAAARAIIDDELIAMGAEPEAVRRHRFATEIDIPF